LEFPALSDVAINAFWVMTSSATSERVCSMAGYVVNSRRANLKSSPGGDTRYLNSGFKAKTEAFKADQNVSHFYVSLFQELPWLCNESLTKFPLACDETRFILF